MKVTLIDHTQNAIDKLIFTKSTRLKMSPDLMNQVQNMTNEEKMQELEYMSNTIKSSWEFVNYTFLIEGVSRAFTHQFVRNRQGSYAQQTMRILDVSGFEYVTGPSIAASPEIQARYDAAMETINKEYEALIEMGAKIEDARGILPTNICTNIVAQYNLRTISDLVASRSSPRTQGEFRDVMESMYVEIIKVHPWTVVFLRDIKYDAVKRIEGVLLEKLKDDPSLNDLIKCLDIIRK